MADETLQWIERRVWHERQQAFRAYYDPLAVFDAHEKGLKWGRLATLDEVLSILRAAIDGSGGASAPQVARQRSRVTEGAGEQAQRENAALKDRLVRAAVELRQIDRLYKSSWLPRARHRKGSRCHAC